MQHQTIDYSTVGYNTTKIKPYGRIAIVDGANYQGESKIMEYTKITREELMALPKSQFIERCLEWNKVFNDGKLMDVVEPSKCPVHIWVAHNDAFCMHDLVANTAVCPVCGLPCCPDCHSHHVTQVSRVTGYLSDVSGWNASKLQEFEDRKRTDVATFS